MSSPKVDSRVERSILPIPDQPQFGLTTYDAKDPDTKYPPIKEIRTDAPDIVYMILDDVGLDLA